MFFKRFFSFSYVNLCFFFIFVRFLVFQMKKDENEIKRKKTLKKHVFIYENFQSDIFQIGLRIMRYENNNCV